MRAPWKPVLVVAVVAVVGRAAADPPKPYTLPMTPIEVLGVVHRCATEADAIKELRDSNTKFPVGGPELRQLRTLGVSDKVLAAVTADSLVPAAVEVVQAAAVVPAAPGRPTGTWVRDSGPVRVTAKFAGDTLTVTATVADDGDESVTLTIDADYSVSPDGVLFGVISGIDCDHPQMAAAAQKLTGHTFSGRCRVVGDALVVKDVKCFGSGLSGESPDFASAALVAAGRYAREGAAKPPGRARVGAPPAPGLRGMTLPSPDYLKHGRRYFPPATPEPAPMPRLSAGGPVDTLDEECRKIDEFWRRLWFANDPARMTPERRAGGRMSR